MCAIQSDDWHADETVVFINGEKYYLWLAIDSETRFILAFYLTKSRSSDSAYTLISFFVLLNINYVLVYEKNKKLLLF